MHIRTPSVWHFRTDRGLYPRITPILIAALLFQPGMLFPGHRLANLGRMGRCLFEPGRKGLGNDQHRQTQAVHHPQGVLEIDALVVLELGQHADGDPAMPRRLVNGHPFPSPRCANAVAQLVNGGSLILVQFTSYVGRSGKRAGA
ncbi:hypothetical protein D9M69_143520 [compost metagenome]